MQEKEIKYRSSDICVCCGEPVPEGRMICVKCERGVGLQKDTPDSFLIKLWKMFKSKK